MTAALDWSLEQHVAMMTPAEQELYLAGIDLEELMWDWGYQGRPSQLLPMREDEPGYDFGLAVVLAGRGFGKTLTGSQWIRELDTRWHSLGRDTSHLRVALLGRTVADVRDVMLEGPSGLLNIWPPSVRDRVVWTPSRRRVDLPNGAACICFSAEEPDQLRGPAFHASWADEIASYKQLRDKEDATAWENLRLATRLGELPQVLGTGTPKRVPLIKQLVAEANSGLTKMLLRRGKTTDNIALATAYLAGLKAKYEGTTLGRQELDGELLDDVKGAMVSEMVVQAHRVRGIPGGAGQWIKLIGVDPSVAERPTDECGIVVVYVSATYPVEQRHAFVVEDLSLQASPTVWMDVVVEAAVRHDATIIAEINNGGALIKSLMKGAAAKANVKPPALREVWSSKSKKVRAEPVGQDYDRGHVHHINVLAELEDQITSWVAGESGYSPDRMDALVNACAAGLHPEALVSGAPGSVRVQSAAQRRLPAARSGSRR